MTYRTIWSLMVLGLMGRPLSKRMSKISNRHRQMGLKTATCKIVPISIQGKGMIWKRVHDDLLQEIHHLCHRKNTWNSTNSRIVMITQLILRTQWRRRFGVSLKRNGSITWSKRLLTCSLIWCLFKRGAQSVHWLHHASTTKIILRFCKKDPQLFSKENSNSIYHPRKER